MFSRNRQLLATAMFLLDGVILAGAWLLAYWLRFYGLGIASPLGIPSPAFHLWVGAVLTPVGLLVLRTFRLYRSARTERLSHELFVLTEGVLVIGALAGLGSFFARGELPRTVVLLFALLAATGLWTTRIVLRAYLRALRRQGRNLRHVMVVGTGDPALKLISKLEQHPDFGIAIRGLIASDPARVGATVGGHPVLGTIGDLAELVESTGTDFVYVALARSEWQAEEEALVQLENSTVAVRLVPDLGRAYTLNAAVEDMDGLPVVLVSETPEQGWNGVIKRAFDLAFSAAGLVVLSPVLAAIAIWVRIDSPGPVFYGQERVGVNGRRFRMYSPAPCAPTPRPGRGGLDHRRRSAPHRGGRAAAAARSTSCRSSGTCCSSHEPGRPAPGAAGVRGPLPRSIPRYMLRHTSAGTTGWRR
jgi:hypothetical protein